MSRLNVYAEELTSETEVVTKTVTDDEFGTRTFYGLRFFLKSPPELHHSPEDDDRSAITLWVKWTKADGTDITLIGDLLDNLKMRLSEIIQQAPLGVGTPIDPEYASEIRDAAI